MIVLAELVRWQFGNKGVLVVFVALLIALYAINRHFSRSEAKSL
jgi:hypothetical protein